MAFIPKLEFDLLNVIFIVFSAMVFIQLVFLIIYPSRLLRKRANLKTKLKNYPKVSVIICSRNEEDHLHKLLPLILEQDYPEFEVIIVNDQSMDESGSIIQALQNKYTNLRLIDLKRNQHKRIGKKLPLTVGIKGARHDYVLLTDADCRPSSKKWIRHMMDAYTGDKEIVLGYSPYKKEKGFLNKLIRFDTSQIGITYMSFSQAGSPYMGVGRNLSYKKDLFFKVDGFKKHYHVQSGDDDLFVQDVALKGNTAINLDPKSFVYSKPKNTWKEWIRQKQRHFTTSTEYRLINKILLGIFPLSMFLMLSSFVILLVNYEWWPFVLAIFGLRTVIFWMVFWKLLSKLKEKDLRVWFPIMEIIHFVIIPFIYYSTNRTSKAKW